MGHVHPRPVRYGGDAAIPPNGVITMKTFYVHVVRDHLMEAGFSVSTSSAEDVIIKTIYEYGFLPFEAFVNVANNRIDRFNLNVAQKRREQE